MRDRILLSILVLGLCAAVLSGCKKREAKAAPLPDPIRKGIVESEKGLNIPRPVMQADEFTEPVPPVRPPQEIPLVCRFSQQTPVIDGTADEAVWDTIRPITTLDAASQRPIQLKSFHNGQSVFILATYPDSGPSESHKSWFWDAREGVYKPGGDREDMFVLKWRISGNELSFSPDRVVPHTADIWFWKACRTNPAGFLDDKHQEVTIEKTEDALELPSDQYGTLYLRRVGDAGKSAYEEKIFFEYQGDVLLKYYPRPAEGSRADVRGKGLWKDGRWTIEIQRALDTGHADDVQFSPGYSYLFAVSLYEMAGVGMEPEWFQPLYKTGNAFDRLTLRIE